MVKKYTIEDLRKQPFSLVLSGGAALGYMHIGVIKFLEENNLVPDEIIGTSMGSLIGALYASGHSSKDISNLLTQNSFLKFINFKFFNKTGIVDYKKFLRILDKIFFNKTFYDLDIDLKVIATRLDTFEKTVFSKKNNVSISESILASSSFPFLISKAFIKDIQYTDGSFTSNLGIEESKHGNIILAVDLFARKNLDVSKLGNHIIHNVNFLYITIQTLEKTKTSKNLLLIEPSIKGFSPMSFFSHKKLIDRGYIETKDFFLK